MHELSAILKAWRNLEHTNKEAVLATVVHVTGSAYRRPGARMLVLPDGRRIGSVSGGCLEGEITKKAWWFTGQGVPVVRRYDTTSDEDAVWEFGLGCNGVVQILLERVDRDRTIEMLEFLDAHRISGVPAIVATVIRTDDSSNVRVGDRLLLDETLRLAGALAGHDLAEGILPHALSALHGKESRLVHFGQTEVFVEWSGPPLSLVIFGAGHDAIPLVDIAAQLGWNITVADGRQAYARVDRFPKAKRVVLMSRMDLLRDVVIDEETVVVMMTHNFPMDVRLVPEVVSRKPRYMGLLGPRTRAEKLFHDIATPMPRYVHAPVGLDLGADTPEAIALSIASEIQAVCNRRSGAMLRLRDGTIHFAAREEGVSMPSIPVEAVRPSYCESTIGGNV